MIRPSRFHLTVASLALFMLSALSACGGKGDSVTNVTDTTGGGSQPPAGPQAKATIGSGGGEVGFADGRFKLTVPAGALDTATEITVTELTGSAIPSGLKDPGIRRVFDMEPNGLRFSTPATVELRLAVSDTLSGVPMVGLISESNGVLEELLDQSETEKGDSVTVNASIAHFSRVAQVEEDGVRMTVTVDPDLNGKSITVGSSFQVTATLTHDAQSSASGTITDATFDLVGPIIVDVPGHTDPTGDFYDADFPLSGTFSAGEAQEFTGTMNGKCSDTGDAALVVLQVVWEVGILRSFVTSVRDEFTGAPISGSGDVFGVLADPNVRFKCVNLTPPSVDNLLDVTLDPGQTGTEDFFISGVGPLTVTTQSLDQSVLPDAKITGQAGCTAQGDCKLQVAPVAQSGKATVIVTLKDTYGQSAEGTFTVWINSNSTPPPAVSLGVMQPPAGGELEGVSVMASPFADLTGNLLTTISDGSGGYVVFDPITGDVLRDHRPVVQGFERGAVPISASSPGPNSAAAVFAFGYGNDDSSINEYDPSGLKWVDASVPVSGGVSDAVDAGNSLTGGEMVVTQPAKGILSITEGQDQTFKANAPFAAATALGGAGAPISAFELVAGGPVLVVSVAPNVGVDPTNGTLYYVPRDGSAPVKVGPVGIEPRKVRCVDVICGVTGNSDKSLTILHWDGQGIPTIVGTATVGDGPVGLDLAKLPNGDIVIGTAGFNDQTFTLTEVTADGTVVSNTTRSVDAGCYAPSNIAFFQDADGTKAMVTCFYSGTLDVLMVAPGS